MPSEVRDSPSGRVVEVTAGVDSVFGRVGNVIAFPADYDTDQITNESLVPGATVTEALDFLLANQTPYAPGTTHDTFSGGIETGAATVNGTIGDHGWNMLSTGGGAVGHTCNKLSAAGTDAFGIYRMTSVTNAVSTPAGFRCFLGSNATNGGPIQWNQFVECTWRARFDPSTATTNLTFALLFSNEPGGTINIGFFVTMLGVGGNANYQIQAFNGPLGGFTTFPTTVPVDADFHDFTLERVSDTQVDFRIDGSLVGSVTDPNSLPTPTQAVVPLFSGLSLNNSPQTPSFMDVDDFVLAPAAA